MKPLMQQNRNYAKQLVTWPSDDVMAVNAISRK